MGEKYGVVGSGEIWEEIALCFDDLITIKMRHPGIIEEKISVNISDTASRKKTTGSVRIYFCFFERVWENFYQIFLLKIWHFSKEACHPSG